jgi:hypothetical protein
MIDQNRQLIIGIFGVILIIILLYPYSSNLKENEISVGLYYVYHFEDDLSSNWYGDANAASKIAEERLNSLAIFNEYYFTFHIGGAYRIEDVEFGHGAGTPEFDVNKTMNQIMQELIDPQSNFLEEKYDSNITVLVFPLSKCVSRQYTIVSGQIATPIFMSYNAILAEIHFERFILEHEILHTFGLPDRNCDEGINCEYPDDELSVMGRTPEKLYLSRSDYLSFGNFLTPIDLSVVATREGSDKLPRPRLNDDGSCPGKIIPTREWRLIHGD